MREEEEEGSLPYFGMERNRLGRYWPYAAVMHRSGFISCSSSSKKVYYRCGRGSKYLAYRYLTLPGLNRVFVLCKNSLRRAYTFNSTLKRYYQFVPLHSSDKS